MKNGNSQQKKQSVNTTQQKVAPPPPTAAKAKSSGFMGVIFSLSFMLFVILIVYMKYSGNCGLMGNAVESMVGSMLCGTQYFEETTDTLNNSQRQNGTKEDSQNQVDDPFAAADDFDRPVNEESEINSVSHGDGLFDTEDDDIVNLNPNSGEKQGAFDIEDPDESEEFKIMETTADDSIVTYETPALLVAENKSNITSRIPGRIKSIGFRAGEEFQKGDILVTFDCKEIELDLEIQKEVLVDKEASYSNLKKLLELNSTSEYSVVKAKSERGQTKKHIEKHEAQLKNCVIKAQYSGKVISTEATEDEFLFAGKEIMTVNNNQDLLVKAYVPIIWLKWLRVGTTFRLCFNSGCYTGAVSRIGAEVDAISQTLDIFGKIGSDEEEGLIAGLSGQLTFDKQ